MLTVNSSLYPVWDDESLAALFSTSTTSASTTRTNSSPSPTISNPSVETTGTAAPGSVSSTPPTNLSAPSKTPVAAIAGGAVGGVAILVALILSIWWIRARKKKQEKDRLARESHTGIAELHNNHTYPELSTERTPEMHGVSKEPHYQVDNQKNDVSIKQGPFEVHG